MYAVFKRYNLKFIHFCKKYAMQTEDKSEKVSMQFLTKCALKQCTNNHQIHFRALNAVLMTFEAKKAVNLISKSG